jgi:hypothetical protein
MVIRAKYDGKCRRCGQVIKAGEQIEWSRESGSQHVTCPVKKVASVSTFDGPTFKLGGGSGYGCRGWRVGQTVHSNDKHIADGWPEFVTVLSATSRRVYEDGLSFGVGDESGYIYTATCRAATELEEQIEIEKREKSNARKNSETHLRELKDQIKKTGERPNGTNDATGEFIADSFTAYGGGSRFVLGTEWIWFLENNGSDGDDWSANNVRTGGAGAVGWRVPRTEDLAAEIMNTAAVALAE